MIHHGDSIEVMATLPEASVDAIVTDPPYGLEFMGKEWDRIGDVGTTSHSGPARIAAGERGQYGKVTNYGSSNVKCRNCGKWQWDHVGRKCECELPDFPSVTRHQGVLMGRWHQRWAEAAYRVAKPSAYLLAFGGTRTVHRMTCALEDAGWIIRDMLVWGYASGFPKSKASLKPAWEPIVMARKPGPLRMLAIDECRIGYMSDADATNASVSTVRTEAGVNKILGKGLVKAGPVEFDAASTGGRWPANIVLTDSIFGEEYSRFFLIPKAARSDREPIDLLTGDAYDERQNVHPTVKPVDLMRHLVRLVTPTGGVVLDPFLGSGTTALAAEMEGFQWIGIEREGEYVAIAEARLNGTQKGMAL